MIQQLHRTFFLTSGLLSLLLGIIGIFVPLLPTTPFLLLAAYCFSNSSERLHSWLLNHKTFGPLIRDWEEHGVIRLRIKWIATISMCLLVSYPLIFKIEQMWLKGVVAGTIACVLVFIWTRPSTYTNV